MFFSGCQDGSSESSQAKYFKEIKNNRKSIELFKPSSVVPRNTWTINQLPFCWYQRLWNSQGKKWPPNIKRSRGICSKFRAIITILYTRLAKVISSTILEFIRMAKYARALTSSSDVLVTHKIPFLAEYM